MDRSLKDVKLHVCVLLKKKLFKGFTEPITYSILLLFQTLESFGDNWI